MFLSKKTRLEGPSPDVFALFADVALECKAFSFKICIFRVI